MVFKLGVLLGSGVVEHALNAVIGNKIDELYIFVFEFSKVVLHTINAPRFRRNDCIKNKTDKMHTSERGINQKLTQPSLSTTV